MVPFGDTDGVKGFGRPCHSFFPGDLGKEPVHGAVDVEFEFGGGEQVRPGVFDDPGGKWPGNLHFTAVEKFEEAQRVFVFLVRGLIENPGDLDIIFLPGPAGELAKLLGQQPTTISVEGATAPVAVMVQPVLPDPLLRLLSTVPVQVLVQIEPLAAPTPVPR